MPFASPKLPSPSFVQSCSALSAPQAVFRDRHRDPAFGTYIENDCSSPPWIVGWQDAPADGTVGPPSPERDDTTLRLEAEFLHSAVACQVSLLPRHWNWLSQRSDGVSTALQQLVDEALHRTAGSEAEVRGAREAAYRALRTLAGDAPGFDDACCALFAGDREAFERHTAHWPRDVVAYGLRLAAPSWRAADTAPDGVNASVRRPGP